MKVVISFEQTRIVVPCRVGEITVRGLIDLATMRYKKAIGKPNTFWVSVTSLKLAGSGGMLDPDDLISDVCNDGEDLIAVFDSEPITGHGRGGTEGGGMSSITSGSSKKDTCKKTEIQILPTKLLQSPAYMAEKKPTTSLQTGRDKNRRTLKVRIRLGRLVNQEVIKLTESYKLVLII